MSEENLIDKFKSKLREDQRIKYGCDYTVIQKYGIITVICIDVYRESIEEIAKSLEVKIDNLVVLDGHLIFNKKTEADIFHIVKKV